MMKRLLLLSLFVLGFTFSSQAQEIARNAIGLRLGDNKGFGTEINYQHGLKENKRLEFGLSWHSGSKTNAYKLTGLHQWVWHLEDRFNWYAGVGGGLGSVQFDKKHDYYHTSKSDTFIFVAGDIGIEYNFNIPLLLSLDFRPEIGFGDYRDDLNFDIALGIRYQF